MRLLVLLLLIVSFTSSFQAQIPTLNCPADTTIFNSSACTSAYSYSIACASNCTGISIYQSDLSGLSSGDDFPLGTTSQQYTITNGSDSSTCNFSITVVDTISPEVFCLGTQNVSANLNCQATLGDYTSIVSSSDNCGISSITQSPAFGTTINGSELVTIYATDNSNNIDSCSFLIIVDDNLPPVVTCPTDSNVYIDSSCFYSLDDLTGYLIISDNCDPNPIINQNPPLGTVFNIGDDPFISFNVTDISGNTSVCSYRISVIDSIPPTLICPSDQSDFIDNNCETILGDYTGLINSVDNCPGSVSVLQSPVAGTAFTGTSSQIISFTATDLYGNSNSCSIAFHPIDTIAPTLIQCVNDTIRYVDSNCTYFMEDFSSLLQISDNCQNNFSFTQSPNVGTPLSSGSNSLTTITASDSSGNSISCLFNVDVQDNKPPNLICPSNPNVPVDTNCSYILPDYQNSINLSDNCDSYPTFSQSVSALDTLIGVGTQQNIILSSTDFYGNTTSCSFTITLVDTTAPQIFCPDTQYVDLDANCLYQVPDISLLTTTWDYCDANPIISQNVPSGSSAGGINTIYLTSTDTSGNTSSCPVVLIPNDTINPTIICPDNVASCNPIVSFVSPSAFDDCGTVNLIQTDTTNLSSGNTFPIGITNLNFVATDLVGNQASCSIEIEIFIVPEIDAGNDLQIEEGNSILIDASSTNCTQYQWYPLYNMQNPFTEDPTVSPLYSTTYFVNVESADGCTATDSLIVFVSQIENLEINNIITPNGDGKNDTWDINKPSVVSGCPVSIYNRWGKIVWSSNNYNNNWTGVNFDGEILPDGTYYYTIICQGDQYSGSILLLK